MKAPLPAVGAGDGEPMPAQISLFLAGLEVLSHRRQASALLVD